MTTKDLVRGDAELWHAANHHAFLDAEREAFRRVAQHEQAFWEMAYAGGHV